METLALLQRLRVNVDAGGADGAEAILRPGANLIGNNAYELRVVESFLIQAYGEDDYPECEKCERSLGIFTECRTIKGWQGGVCGNCKRGDRGMQCTKGENWKSAQEDAARQKEALARKPVTTRSGRKTSGPVSYAYNELYRSK